MVNFISASVLAPFLLLLFHTLHLTTGFDWFHHLTCLHITPSLLPHTHCHTLGLLSPAVVKGSLIHLSSPPPLLPIHFLHCNGSDAKHRTQLTPPIILHLSKTPLPCRSPPRPLCSSTCCLSDLTPTPPLPICSSHTGLLAHPQFSQTHSCLKGLPLLLPLLRKFIQFSLLTSSSLCSNVTF